MLSIDFIRNNIQKVKDGAKNKNRVVDVDKIILLDDERKVLIQQSQKLREERNSVAKQKPTEEMRTRGKQIKDELKIIEEKLTKTEVELKELVLQVPNVPLDEVPVGKDSTANSEIKKWGSLPSFDFTPKSHIELGESLDILDLVRGVKVSGFRGYFLKGYGALLHMSILMYAFQKLAQKGYTPLIAPALVKSFTLFGTGQFPWGKDEVYQVNDDNAFLAGTAEVPVTSYLSGEIIPEKELPKKFVALSPCFRKEAGAYGKDTRGLYRLHEFWKIEQIIISKNNIDDSKILHEELQKNAEEILQELGLPYRVLLMCTGDMGEPQIKKYDIETWMPSRNAYGETMSNSIMGDFQTRRLNIKYRKQDGKTEYCYSLNNTAVASPRLLIAILENFQQKDGSILIPKVLQSLVGTKKIEVKK